MLTQRCGAGTSFDLAHFDNLFVYTSSCSNCVRDSMQSSMRVRNIASGRMWYSSYTRYEGARDFDEFSRSRLRAIIDGRASHAIAAEDHVFSLRAALPEWQRQLWVHNVQENNVSSFLHAEMVDAYLTACGYTIEVEPQRSAGVKLNERVQAIDFDGIDEIRRQDYDHIGKLIQAGKAAEHQKLEYPKHHFCWAIVRSGAADEEMQKMFRVYAARQMDVQERMGNIRAEKMGCADDRRSVFQGNQAQRLQIIKTLCRLLRIENSYTNGTVITRVAMEAAEGEILGMAKHLRDAFHLGTEERAGKSAFGLVNKCFRNWGFLQVVAGDRKRPRGQDRGDYKLTGQTQFPLFDQYCRA